MANVRRGLEEYKTRSTRSFPYYIPPLRRCPSPPPSLSILIQPVYRYRGDSFLCGGLKVLILGFIIRLLRNNKMKQLLGDSFSQLVKLRRL